MLYDAQILVVSYVINRAKEMEDALRALNYTQGAISTLELLRNICYNLKL